MDTITIRNGASLSLQVNTDDDEAQSVAIIVKDTVNAASYLIFETANFTANVANLEISAAQTNITPGDYIYQLTVTNSDGTIEKYPDVANCDGDCDFPEFIVCDSLDLGVS